MKHFSVLAPIALCVALPACGNTSTPADVIVVDASADARDSSFVPPPLIDASTDTPPFVVGPPPPCTLTGFVRHIADQRPDAISYGLGGMVSVGTGFVVALRQASSRLEMPTRRDSVEVISFGFDPTPATASAVVYDSTAAGTDLSRPSLVRAGDGALVMFRESRDLQGMPRFMTNLRIGRVDARGTPHSESSVVEGRGEPFAAALPNGTVLVLTPRVVALSSGTLVATPNVLRVRPNGTLLDPMGVDVTNVIPIDATSAFMRPTTTGAAAVFRQVVDLLTVRFDAAGTVDTQPLITRNVDATRLDDVAVFPEGVIAALDEPQGPAHVIRLIVARGDGRLISNAVLERFSGPEVPVVSVTPVHGGAAVTWIRGVGAQAMLRGVVVQPDGVLRGVAQNLVAVPNADGPLITLGEGLALTFAALDRRGATMGLTVGRLCLR